METLRASEVNDNEEHNIKIDYYYLKDGEWKLKKVSFNNLLNFYKKIEK